MDFDDPLGQQSGYCQLAEARRYADTLTTPPSSDIAVYQYSRRIIFREFMLLEVNIGPSGMGYTFASVTQT